jgi:hypothetical protein
LFRLCGINDQMLDTRLAQASLRVWLLDNGYNRASGIKYPCEWSNGLPGVTQAEERSEKNMLWKRKTSQ